MINVSLNAAGSIITIVRKNGPAIVTGTRNFQAAPSIMTCTGGNSHLMNRVTGHRTIVGARGAFCSIGHFVNHHCSRIAARSARITCGILGINGGIGVSYPRTNRRFSPRRVSTRILHGLTSSTNGCLNRGIARTIVAIPTCFGSSRHRTAGSTNGVTNLRILQVVGRPATTSLTCNLSHGDGRAVLMFSLKNNAFSMSVLRINSNIFRILTADNSARLNNSSFSGGVMSFLTNRFRGVRNVSLHGSGRTLRHLARTTRGTGVRLSDIARTRVGLPFVATARSNPGRLRVALAHTGFRRLYTSLVSHYHVPIRRTLGSTGLSGDTVSRIILINNSAHVPTVGRIIGHALSGRPGRAMGPSRIMTINTTVRNNMLTNRIGSVLLLSIAPLSLNMRALNNIVAGLVAHGAAVPAGGSRIFSATRSNRAGIRVGILRNRHRVTTSGGDLKAFRLSNVPPTPHNIPRVRIVFSVSTGNVLGIATGSGKANGRRAVAVSKTSALSSGRISHVIGSTRTGTTTSGRHHRHVSLGGRTSSLTCRTRGRLTSVNSGIPTTSGRGTRKRVGRLGSTVTTRGFSAVGALARRLRRALCNVDAGLCRRTNNSTTNTPSTTPDNDSNNSSSIVSTRFSRPRSGWSANVPGLRLDR